MALDELKTLGVGDNINNGGADRANVAYMVVCVSEMKTGVYDGNNRADGAGVFDELKTGAAGQSDLEDFDLDRRARNQLDHRKKEEACANGRDEV